MHPVIRNARSALAAAGLLVVVLPSSAGATPPEPIPTDLVTGASTTGSAADDDAGGTPLEGLFRLAPGQCSNGGVTEGSYFRMIQPRGNAENGPFINNGNSPCGDDTYTPMNPGDDGGLATGNYQPNPEPAFDNAGNAQARGIFEPLNFQGIDYGGSTNEVDPQTKQDVPAPVITTDGNGNVGGDVRAVSVAWNNQHFNQGAPKPDGSTPGLTKAPHGTFDSATGAFVIEWTSTISGGPFDGFTGLWHLEGTFEEGAGPTAPRSSSGGAAADQGSSGGGSQSVAAGAAQGTSGAGSGAVNVTGSNSRGKSLPFTGPSIPGWAAPMFLTLGVLSGLEWLRSRKSGRA